MTAPWRSRRCGDRFAYRIARLPGFTAGSRLLDPFSQRGTSRTAGSRRVRSVSLLAADAADLPSQRQHPLQGQSRRHSPARRRPDRSSAMLLGAIVVRHAGARVRRAAGAVQPRHHVGDDGIDCRYCHTSVETSPFAGIPPTKTCMNCHSQIWHRRRFSSRSAPASATTSRCTGSACTTCRTSSTSTTASTSRRASAARPATAASTRCR